MARRKQSTDDSATDTTEDGQTTVPTTEAAEAAAESAGIVGATGSASGLASDNLGEKTVIQEAEGDTLSGPMAALDDGGVESFIEQGKTKQFSEDEQGRGTGKVATMLPINPSADYPGRDQALAATEGGRLMPGNLDAILRARFAGTPVPGDAQLMTAEEIDSLKSAFVEGIEPSTAVAGEGTSFVKGDNPNAFVHENEVNPNTPTNERVEK